MNSLGTFLPINWFDLLVIAVLVVGAFRGRSRGMSQELIPLIKWLTIVLVCGFGYSQIAPVIAREAVVSQLSASYTAYLGLALATAVVFALVNRQLHGKIVGSDAFGKGEYYLGIMAGMLRFACMLVFFLSLLNARLYTAQEIAEHNAYMQKNFDSDFFPTVQQTQQTVFKESFSGPVIHDSLGFLLIEPAIANFVPLKRKELDLPTM